MRRRVLLGAAAGAALGGLAAFALAAPEPQLRRIVARKFTYLPNEVTLTRGVPALLEFTAVEVVMGFACPDFGIRADIVPGQVAQVRFTPDRAGVFPYHCDIFCGDGHETMTGSIRVVAPA